MNRLNYAVLGGEQVKRERLLLSAAGALMLSALVNVFGYKELLALFIAVSVHELGHFVTINLLKLHVTGVHIEASGLRLDYLGIRSPLKDIISAFAGPMAGILYYVVVLCFDRISESAVIGLSSQISLLYSLFNLLPIMPLDGGRIMYGLAEKLMDEAEAKRISSWVSKIFSIAFFLLGLICMLEGEGSGMFAAGLWILLMMN